MRGRDTEWALAADVLHRVRQGHGHVLLVEGEAGTGKSSLLAEVTVAARAQDFSVISVHAHELERAIPLCSLLLALSDAIGQDLTTVIGADTPNSQLQAIAVVRGHIQRLASSGPVLVTVDDVQFADPVTLLALRLLPRQLSGQPVGWLLARATGPGTPAESLFSLLASEGAAGITLGGLSDDAVAMLVADLTGGQPDGKLRAMLGDLAGNPMLICEFITGLREEGLLRSSGDQVTVLAEQVPRRLLSAVRGQIRGIGRPTRHMLEAAALLGQSFAVADVAELLGQRPAALLSAVDDAIAAGILIADGDMLAFRETVAWRVVADAVPDPAARALHLQFAELLLERGSTLPAAEYLLKGAWRGDRRELDMLTRAAVELMQAAPGTAADLALRSLELTDVADSAWLDRSLIASRSLIAARRLAQALEITEAALSRPAAIVQQAELRCALAASYNLMGQPDRARTEARWVLACPDLPESVHEEASVLLLQALVGLPDQQEAEDVSRAVLAAHRDVSGRQRAAAAGALAALQWRQGRIADGMRLLREAVAGRPGGSGRLRPLGAQLDLASRLIDIRELDEARALIDAPVEDVSMASVADSPERPPLLRARIHLAEGRLDAASDEARAALSADPGADGYLYDVAAKCLLARIALRRGELQEGEAWLARLPTDAPGPSSGPLSVLSTMLTASAVEISEGPDVALRLITWLYDDISEFKWLLIADPEIAPWLVRLALAAGDRKRATFVAVETGELGRANDAFPAVAASGKHAAGLCYREAESLHVAAGLQPDRWTRASAAEDLGTLLAARNDVRDAITFLDQAQDGYLQLGAVRDLARVRHRLRVLGVVRRRSTAARRPADGLDSLTEAEAGIAELVARGLTNRQIAEQSFISVHTAAFHLRQIFRKLGVSSRVEVARLVVAARRDADQPAGHTTSGSGPHPPGALRDRKLSQPGRRAHSRQPRLRTARTSTRSTSLPTSTRSRSRLTSMWSRSLLTSTRSSSAFASSASTTSPVARRATYWASDSTGSASRLPAERTRSPVSICPPVTDRVLRVPRSRAARPRASSCLGEPRRPETIRNG